MYLLDEVATTIPFGVASTVRSDISSFQLHCRLGHPSLEVLKKMCLELSSVISLSCESCEFAKHHRVSYPPRVNKRALSPFDPVHSDVWGPCPVTSKSDVRYFVTFVDDYSRSTWLYLMKSRSELFYTFSAFCSEVRTQCNYNVRILCSDNAKEYFFDQFSTYMT